ncbi:transposase [Ktedonobacter robiniae]|uniref:Transposase n=1 Tax=Ktedonobacter robiniae TaxID=2778365 RepID=A0ABQ3UU88_9CHLR|nr:transposase [Ktedonobacter robiniae]
MLEHIGLALGGQAGARLATHVGMPVCGRTILRALHAFSLPEGKPAPRIVGIDDWCWKRGRTYGSILVDLERHQPIDLLPDRSVETVKSWFQAHPGVEIVSRDGSAEYATAIRQGAPQALQVSDRFHIIQNLAKAVKLLLARCRDEIGSTQWRPLTPPHVQRAQQARRGQRLSQYQQIMALAKEGVKDAEIARRTKLSVRTIQRWRAHDSFPEVKRRQRRSRFDPYKGYVLRRWQEGCTNGYQLWRELREQGYAGSARSVYNFLQPLSKGLVTPALQQELACFSAQETTWLFVRDPDDLDEKQRTSLSTVCQTSATAKAAYQLVQSFMTMVHQRTGNQLDVWLETVAQSQIAELDSFATGIERDKAAVLAGLTLPWSNGQVEGQITKLKLIKRSMYGRAGLDLLRQRVLNAA